MKLRQSICAGVLALMLSIGAEADVWRVNAGIGLGPIILGQPYTSVQKVLTLTDSIVTQTGAYLRFKEGVELEIENQRIVQIVVHQMSFPGKAGLVDVQLDGNLKLGATVPQMEQALGRGYEARPLPVAKSQPPITYHAYKSKGLGVRTEGGKIVEFSIWPRH